MAAAATTRKTIATAAGDEGGAERPAGDRPGDLGRVSPLRRRRRGVADLGAEDDEDEGGDGGDAGAQSQAGGDRVLAHGRAVALDSVDPVGAALDLAHRAGRGDERGDQAEGQRRLRRLLGVLGALLEGLGDDLAGGAGCDALDRPGEDVGERLLAEHVRQPDDRDRRRQQGEDQLEGERPRVAEAVGVAKALERTTKQLPDPDRAQGLDGLVPLELEVAGDRDLGGGAHPLVAAEAATATKTRRSRPAAPRPSTIPQPHRRRSRAGVRHGFGAVAHPEWH